MKRILMAMAVAGWLLGPVAQAADVGVQPVRLAFAKGQDRHAITITNRGPDALSMQVDPVSWAQADGQDHYAPTRDLLINPPLFTIAPGKSQVLRVGLRKGPAPAATETAYRLLLREVPPAETKPADAAGTGPGSVRVLLQLRVPVYVAPSQVARAELWRARRSADGGLELTVANTGNVHMVVTDLQLRAPDAQGSAAPIAQLKANAAVFPGQSRSWQLRRDSGAIDLAQFSLDVTTDQGPHRVALDLDHP